MIHVILWMLVLAFVLEIIEGHSEPHVEVPLIQVVAEDHRPRGLNQTVTVGAIMAETALVKPVVAATD